MVYHILLVSIEDPLLVFELKHHVIKCFSAIFEHRPPLLKNVQQYLLEDFCIFQTNQFLIEIRNSQLKEEPFL